MYYRLALAFCLILLVGCAPPTAESPSATGNAPAANPADFSGPMVWGYFFRVAEESDPLHPIEKALEAQEYEIVATYPDDESLAEGWIAQMTKLETHSAESLKTRNAELKALAASHRVEYQGAEVLATLAEEQAFEAELQAEGEE